MHYVDDINVACGGAGTKLYSTADSGFKRLCLQNNLHLLDASVRHLGTDINYKVLENLYAQLKEHIDFHFLTPVKALTIAEDGTYEAEGKGIGGKVPVTVTVKDGKISDVTVGDNSETQGIGSKAIEQLPEAIVAAGGTEGVDGVSGATITSKAIFSAVEDALAQAGK